MKKLFAAFLLMASFAFTTASPLLAASAPAPAPETCQGVGCVSSKPEDLGIPNIPLAVAAKRAIQLLSFLAGALSAIFIIVGGFKYITSGGNSQRTESAKQTIMYAAVGLIVSMIAFEVVGFVIGRLF